MSRFDGKVVDFPIVIDEVGFIEGFHFFYKIFSLVFFLLSSRNLKFDLFTRFISKKSRERNTVSHRSAGSAAIRNPNLQKPPRQAVRPAPEGGG